MIDIISDHIGAPPKLDNLVQPHVVFLLDESGSMSGFRKEVVSTFNEYVAKVRETAKSISLYTFDSHGVREKIYKVHPSRVKKLTEDNYAPNSATPLYDAMGITIGKFEFEARPVHFIVHTDGMENASQEWTKFALDERIARLQSVDENGHPWLFTYLMEGLGGREALKDFQGVKLGMSNASRGMALNSVAVSTTLYASTMDNNPVNYTSTGTDTEDLDTKTNDNPDAVVTTSGGAPA